MTQDGPPGETYNPWTIVNLVFHHLVEHGCHPTLGTAGHPGEPAAALLRALGITPTVQGVTHASPDIRDHLAELRAKMLDD
ncbi:MAG TPA: hypothetical protein VH333_06380 [Pseudonocardiaceae bacterium]|jgi:hypothetical protein|nr:hypothetical protein [Pseudonocardiaceae bacterium]